MLSQRLHALRRERGLTQSDLASRLGVSQQAIAKWESAKSLPEPGMISHLAALFSVSADYLLGVTDSLSPAGAFSGVKIIGSVKAGYGALAFEEELGEAPADVRNPEDYRFLTVKGDSMAPYIREGDLALVRLQRTLQNGDLGVFIYRDEEATLKKFHASNGTVTLTPFNDSYETLTLSGEELGELIIFGRVIETHSSW